MKRLLPFAIFVVLLIVAVGVFVAIRLTADYPTAQAALIVRTGTASVLHQGNDKPESVEAGRQVPIVSGDSLHIQGDAALSFTGAQTELGPDTQLEVTHYGTAGNEAQIELLVKTGQISQRITGYTNDRSRYTINSASATITTRSGEFVTWIDDADGTHIGVIAGTTTVSGQGKSLTVGQGQGTTVTPGQTPDEVLPWSRVRVILYRPDGSTVQQAAALVNNRSSERYDFLTQRTVMVPNGIYHLVINTVEAYEITDLNLTSGTLTELPITLSEILFATTDAAGNNVPYNGLEIQGSNKIRVARDEAVLVSPGKWTMLVARDEKPSAIQPVSVNLAPGQRVNISLRNDLFGGGTVDVHVVGPDGGAFNPVNVAVYQMGAENGQPMLTFKSDSGAQPLPAGNYVISVLTPLADRIEITMQQNQQVSVQTKLGHLKVNYSDSQGRPIPRTAYIAGAEEMQLLNLPVTGMRQTPYGLAVNTGVQVVVPAGRYTVQVDDSKDVTQPNVIVEAGKVTTVDLKLAP